MQEVFIIQQNMSLSFYLHFTKFEKKYVQFAKRNNIDVQLCDLLAIPTWDLEQDQADGEELQSCKNKKKYITLINNIYYWLYKILSAFSLNPGF